MIVKIFRRDEWDSAVAAGRFAGSADDVRDGFIHFSTADQLPGTLAKHYRDETELVIVEVDEAAFGNELRWEASRDGEKFPHLYDEWNFTTAPPRVIDVPPGN